MILFLLLLFLQHTTTRTFFVRFCLFESKTPRTSLLTHVSHLASTERHDELSETRLLKSTHFLKTPLFAIFASTKKNVMRRISASTMTHAEQRAMYGSSRFYRAQNEKVQSHLEETWFSDEHSSDPIVYPPHDQFDLHRIILIITFIISRRCSNNLIRYPCSSQFSFNAR